MGGVKSALAQWGAAGLREWGEEVCVCLCAALKAVKVLGEWITFSL